MKCIVYIINKTNINESQRSGVIFFIDAISFFHLIWLNLAALSRASDAVMQWTSDAAFQHYNTDKWVSNAEDNFVKLLLYLAAIFFSRSEEPEG